MTQEVVAGKRGDALDALSTLYFVVRSILVAIWRRTVPFDWYGTRKSFRGKLVLITGAGGGIGNALALRFAERGAHLLLWDLCADLNQRTADACRLLGATVFTQCVDVGDREAVYAAADAIEALTDGQFRLDSVHVVVNSAGLLRKNVSFLEAADASLEQLQRVNVWSAFWTSKAFLPAMVKRNDGGHFTTIASASSFCGAPGLVDYAASKYAVFGFMEGLQNEMQCTTTDEPRNVHFTTVCPHFVQTPLVENVKLIESYRLLSAAQVAERTVDAMERRESILFLPSLVNVMFVLKGLLPWNLFAFLALKRRFYYH